ncbi:MAG: glycosyltransferase [Cyanobacteria bacterium J06597_1]
MTATFNDATVTVICVPRERFCSTQESLESLYAHTRYPFKLVCVDGNSPRAIQRYLKTASEEEGFEVIRSDRFLSPNQARNIGLKHAKTKYVVFFDNDVIVTPGWLEHLVRCAEETEATVVGPLVCQYKPLHSEIHFAGGESHIWVDKLGRRRLREKMYKQGKAVTQIQPQLQRTPTELAEFHCVLVRRSLFDRIGGLDEGMLNTKEHLDFCMTVAKEGRSVYFEPSALVTYVPGRPKSLRDVHFYMVRWSDAWQQSSLEYLRTKWNLAEDAYFTTKYKKMGWRRRRSLVDPLIRKLTFGVGFPILARIIYKLDRIFNRYVMASYNRSLNPAEGE